MTARDWTTHPPDTTAELETCLIEQGVLPQHAREARIGTEEAIALHAAAKNDRDDDGRVE